MNAAEPPGRTLGRGMLMGSWLVGMVLAFLWFDRRLDDQANPNRQPASRTGADWIEVELATNRWNSYIASGQVNGEPVEFLVDTGATDVVVPAHLAGRLGLRGGMTSRAATANGTVEVQAARIARLSIGGLVLDDVDAVINPGMSDDVLLLGMSALGRVEMVHRDGTLVLRQYGGAR